MRSERRNLMANNPPLNRSVTTLESYIAYSPPTVESIVDAERGLDVPYEDRWADELFTWLSSGRSIISYCEQLQKPARSLILSWLNDADPMYDHLKERFEAGMCNRALAMVDDAAEIAEEDLLMGPKGFLDPISMSDKKSRVDAKLRLAALLDPIKFSPTSKVAQNIALTQVNITQKNVSERTDEDLLRVVAEYERRKNLGQRATAEPGRSSGSGSQGAANPPERPLLTP
jgi:hypothetical protein